MRRSPDFKAMSNFFKISIICLAGTLGIASIVILIKTPQDEAHSYTSTEEFENPNLLHQLNIGKTFYTKERKYVFPLNGSTADRNPPTLLWPINAKHDPGTELTSHRIFIATSPNFDRDQIIASPILKWAIYRPDDPLHPGTYYWKYETTYKGRPHLSSAQTFQISSETPVDELPCSTDLVKKLPKHRPRLLTCRLSPEELRKTFNDKNEAQSFIQAADHLIDENGRLIFKIPTAPKGPFPDDWKGQKNTRDAVKMHGRITSNVTNRLLQAYLLTGDENYAQLAIRLAMEAAERTRTSDITLQFTNNFGNAGLIMTMALTLDTCYDSLSEEQKRKLTSAISMRIDSFFEREWANKLEILAQRGHAWQELLNNVLYGAIAVHGETAKSELWIRYIYELWNARFPALGGEDGAWAVGPNYLEHNFETIIRIPAIFQSICGIDLFDHPFYAEVAKYCTALPWMPGFSDGYADYSRRNFNVRDYITALDIVSPSPWTKWYIRNSAPLKKALFFHGLLDWNALVLLKSFEEKRTNDISQLELNNYLFSSTGLAIFHSDRTDLTSNIMLSFKSNPWGPTGHAQREQNTFNIQKNGEPVFFRSGFRISAQDPHNQLYYADSRSKNSILVNSRGQAESSESTGYLTHFFHDDDDEISYVAGQAKNAYNANSESKLIKKELEIFNEERTGGLDIEDFTRHVIFLKPHYIVIYDSLQATTPCDWELMLHAHQETILKDNCLSLEGDNFSATATVLTHNTCKMNLGNDISPSPENWRGMKSEVGEMIAYKPRWHFSAATNTSSEKMKFLTVISIAPKGQPEAIIKEKGSNEIQLGNWKITADINPDSEAFFQVVASDAGKKLTLEPDGQLTFEHADLKKIIEPLDIKKIGRGFW